MAEKYIYGLIGKQLVHSVSAVMFNLYFEQKFPDNTYREFPLKEQELAVFLRGSRHSSIKGLNVTIPYKEKIMSFLDELDEYAEIIGAVNVIQVHKEKLKGFNTDVLGFSRMLKEAIVFKPEKAVVLGAGGAAKGVIYSLFNLGIIEIDFFSRSREKLELMIKKFGSLGGIKGHKWRAEDIELLIKNSDLIINATPIGMYPFIEDSPVEIKYEARSGALVFDLIYNPTETKFLKNAGKKGYRTQNGLDMLIYQAMEALKIWMEIPFDENEFIMRSKQALEKVLSL